MGVVLIELETLFGLLNGSRSEILIPSSFCRKETLGVTHLQLLARHVVLSGSTVVQRPRTAGVYGYMYEVR
jgi:hypothetical protein